MIEGNSEIKNVFPRRRCELNLGKPCIAEKNKQLSGQNQECTPTRTPCYALGKQHRPEDAIKKVE